MDWLDLLAVQGTLKSLLQHHSSKASILWHGYLLKFSVHPDLDFLQLGSFCQRSSLFLKGVCVCVCVYFICCRIEGLYQFSCPSPHMSPSGYQISSFPSLWLEQTYLWAFRTFQGFPGGVRAKEPTFQYGRVWHLILENERDQKKTIAGLPGSPVAKTQVSSVGGVGWIPGKATRTVTWLSAL